MQVATPLICVGGFDSVEKSADPKAFVTWMAMQRQFGPDAGTAALNLSPTDRVLDLGCGPGADSKVLREHSDHVIGLDLSPSMTRKAQAEVPAASFLVADGQTLPFPDNSFDAVWMRLVLVHTPDPAATMREIARVLKPGGRVVLTEPDQGSHLVDTPHNDVFERIRAHRRTTFRNPTVGRNLPELATNAGLTITRTWLNPIQIRSFAIACAAGGPFDVATAQAITAGAITADEGAAYLASLEDLDQRGAFHFIGLTVSLAAHRGT
jgi:SAM-dependent methyltransferase